MNTELFISKRLFFDKANKKLLSQRIIRIALAGIALGLTVMIISVSVVTGFKKEIRDKVIGFGSHIQLTNYDSNNSFETQPVSENQPFLESINKISGVKTIQVFATKPGMIKTDEYIEGIVFKGVNKNYDWTFFEKHLLEGKIPTINDSTRVKEILLSKATAKSLKLKLNDNVLLYFINKNEVIPRMRNLKICGIYDTGFEEFDKRFILGDLKQIQRLNNWNKDEVTGFEININDFKNLDNIEQKVRNTTLKFRDEDSEVLRTISITRLYPQLFDWLSILDMNVWIILILMVMVAAFNMISGLLVLILERASMIGVLKAMGSNSWNIRKIFIYLSVFLTGRGMLWGNVIGILIIIIQKLFHVIHLNPSSYYVPYVPMNFSLLHLILLNIGTIVITSIILIIPSWLISKISPDKSMRFD